MRVIVVQDYRENRAKCTLTPLEGLGDFLFVRLQHPLRSTAKIPLPSGVILHVDGPPLERSDAELVKSGALIVVDSTWARVPKVLARIEARAGACIERRSIPEGIVTAYPRISKTHEDPPTGLASVEAVYVAMAILGDPRTELLASYRWAEDFLRINAERVRRFRTGTDVSSASFPA